jgi:hypothetical protein
MGEALIVHQPAAPVNWSQEIEGARMLLKSGLLPQGIKTPEAALFIILTGKDLGLSPVQSLRSIHTIQGKIEVAADAQLGLFHRSGGKSHWRALTNEQAILELHAPWLTEPHIESFTLEDAKRAKLGGDNWAKYPKAMLRSRAITAGLKSIGFDPTAGIYAPGEIGGVEAVVEGEVVATVELQPETDPVDESLEKMLTQVDEGTAEKARGSIAQGADKLKVLARLTEIVLSSGGVL